MNMFIKANIFGLLGLIVLILTYFSNLYLIIPIVFAICISMLSIYIYVISFEYQRITLIIGRYIKSKDVEYKNLDINLVQMYLASPSFGIIIALNSLLTGFIGGVLARYNFLYLIIFPLTKYFLITLINLPIPYKFIFKQISKALSSSSKEIMLTVGGVRLYLEIKDILKRVPHNREYENWLYQNMPKK